MPTRDLKLEQTNSFAKTYKKLKQNQLIDLEKAIKKILLNPEIGILKTGDLSGVRVHKFSMNKHLTLLAYVYQSNSIVLLAVGPHENFYRSLKL